MIKMLRGFWVDERGSGETFSAIGIVIGMVVLVAIVTSIGVTTGKNKMKGVADDIKNYQIYSPEAVHASVGESGEYSDKTFEIEDGDHTIGKITIKD